MTLCDAGVRWVGGSWNSQDEIVFSAAPKPRPSGASLYRVSALGGEREIVITPDAEKGGSGSCPKFLPGGKALFFDVSGQIRLLSLETGEQRVVVEDGINAYYAPTGHLVYQQTGRGRGAILAAPFDLARLEVTGKATPAMGNIRSVDYAIAEDGTLAYVPLVAGRPLRSLVWVDRKGREQVVTKDKQHYLCPRISPDGKRVAITIVKEANGRSGVDLRFGR